MVRYSFYIGADNKTGKVDYKRVSAIFAEEFQGFTVIPCVGFWEGQMERSCKVEAIVLEKRTLIFFLRRLKDVLEQDCIIYIAEELDSYYAG